MNIRSIFGISLLLIGFFAGAAADVISGKVRNVTASQPAAGDDVVLLRLGHGMQEDARTRTDAQGTFTFNSVSAQAQYLVRVIHQGVNYDQSVTGAAPLAISVFDTVAKIPGLSGNLGIAQVESDAKMVKVTEMYAINNTSEPPVTQAGPRNYEIVLPEKAVFDSVEARRSEGVWIRVPPRHEAAPGRYSIDFPFRPGDTLIKFTYHLPYAGHAALHLRLPYPIQKFAVMHPPSLKFKASRPGMFTNPGQANGFQIEAAVQQPLVGDVPDFEISGAGMAPPQAAAAPAPAAEQPGASAPPVVASVPSSTGQSTQPAATPPTEPKRKSWLLALAVATLLMIGTVFFWRMRAASSQPAAGAPPLVDALKEELFQLEVDRTQGSISANEYAATKKALSTTLQRAVEKVKR